MLQAVSGIRVACPVGASEQDEEGPETVVSESTVQTSRVACEEIPQVPGGVH
jgi:hypothetical protein